MLKRLRDRFRRKPVIVLPTITDWSHAYIVTDHGTYWRRGACGCQKIRPAELVEDE